MALAVNWSRTVSIADVVYSLRLLNIPVWCHLVEKPYRDGETDVLTVK